MGERDIYIDTAVRFLKKGNRPDPRLATVAGESLVLKPHDSTVVEDIQRERERSRHSFLSVLRRAS